VDKKEAIKRILVVDDEIDICIMLVTFLQSCDYDCESSTDPTEALAKLKQERFDLVISDIEMVGMNGLELIKKLSFIAPQLDTIGMTGFTANYTYSDVIEAGAADFISKPLMLPELKAKIERLNRERKMTKYLRDLNTALGVLAERLQKEREHFGSEVTSNLRESVFPYLEKLKNTRLNAEQKEYLEILDLTLLDICSPFTKNLSMHHVYMSSREIQIANLIRAGKGNKEISSILSISLDTVLTHRHRLREKLDLKGKKINLRSYLNSIEF
jgi:DNA-binding NarL/FixJ family response regulator